MEEKQTPKETCQPKKNCKITAMHNIKVSKQSTKEKKQRKKLTHIQTETKPNTKTLNKKTEQPQQQNKTKLENKNENHRHADKSSKRNDQGRASHLQIKFYFQT